MKLQLQLGAISRGSNGDARPVRPFGAVEALQEESTLAWQGVYSGDRESIVNIRVEVQTQETSISERTRATMMLLLRGDDLGMLCAVITVGSKR
jgi:hypothetical protein